MFGGRQRYGVAGMLQEEEAATGDSSFGLGELTGGNRLHDKAERLQPFPGSGEIFRVDDGVADGERVGGERLGGIDGDDGAEVAGVDPGGVDEEEPVGKSGDGRLEVEAAGNGKGVDNITRRFHCGGELPDALGVAAGGPADEEGAAHVQHVAPIEGAGRFDVAEGTMGGEGRRDAGCFGPAGHCPGAGDDGKLVEDDGGVFDEDGVGEIGFGGEVFDVAAQSMQRRGVAKMFRRGALQVDRLPGEVAQLALDDRWAHVPDDGEHGQPGA